MLKRLVERRHGINSLAVRAERARKRHKVGLAVKDRVGIVFIKEQRLPLTHHAEHAVIHQKDDNRHVVGCLLYTSLSSETCALDAVGAEFVRDVEPGEIVTITPNGILSDKSHCLPAEKQGRCIFEYIYFARPDSRIDGINVYSARLLAGRFLAKDSPVDADIVVGVPESGNAAAQGYACLLYTSSSILLNS